MFDNGLISNKSKDLKAINLWHKCSYLERTDGTESDVYFSYGLGALHAVSWPTSTFQNFDIFSFTHGKKNKIAKKNTHKKEKGLSTSI